MTDIKPDLNLSLNESSENRQGTGPAVDPSAEHPIAGYFATAFGFLGIFSIGYVFVPMAIIASFIALFSGQIIWGVFGLMLSFAGLVTSPFLLAFLGLAWLASITGFN